MRAIPEVPLTMLLSTFTTLLIMEILFYHLFQAGGLELVMSLVSIFLVLIVLLISMTLGYEKDHIYGLTWLFCIIISGMAWASDSHLWIGTVGVIDMLCFIACLE